MYHAVLFADDGESVYDYHNCPSVEDVKQYIENQGSRWIFYPIATVVDDHNGLIVESYGEWKHLIGMNVLDAEFSIMAETDREPTDDEIYNRTQYIPDERDEHDRTL